MFCVCYDHQTEEKAFISSGYFGGGGAVGRAACEGAALRCASSFEFTSIVPSSCQDAGHAGRACCVAIDCPGALTLQVTLQLVLLLLDQIKPIEQLVPVS